MSYCRLSDPDCDVYVYGMGEGRYAVHDINGNHFVHKSPEEAISKLRQLIAEGHRVPDDVIPALMREVDSEMSFVDRIIYIVAGAVMFLGALAGIGLLLMFLFVLWPV